MYTIVQLLLFDGPAPVSYIVRSWLCIVICGRFHQGFIMVGTEALSVVGYLKANYKRLLTLLYMQIWSLEQAPSCCGVRCGLVV